MTRGTHPFQPRRRRQRSPTLARAARRRRRQKAGGVGAAVRHDHHLDGDDDGISSTSTPPQPFSPKEIETRSWRRSGDAKWRRGGVRSRLGGATLPRRRTPPFRPPPTLLPSPQSLLHRLELGKVNHPLLGNSYQVQKFCNEYLIARPY